MGNMTAIEQKNHQNTTTIPFTQEELDFVKEILAHREKHPQPSQEELQRQLDQAMTEGWQE